MLSNTIRPLFDIFLYTIVCSDNFITADKKDDLLSSVKAKQIHSH